MYQQNDERFDFTINPPQYINGNTFRVTIVVTDKKTREVPAQFSLSITLNEEGELKKLADRAEKKALEAVKKLPLYNLPQMPQGNP